MREYIGHVSSAISLTLFAPYSLPILIIYPATPALAQAELGNCVQLSNAQQLGNGVLLKATNVCAVCVKVAPLVRHSSGQIGYFSTAVVLGQPITTMSLKAN